MAAAGLGRKLKHRLWGGVTDAIPKDGVRSVFTCQGLRYRHSSVVEKNRSRAEEVPESGRTC